MFCVFPKGYVLGPLLLTSYSTQLWYLIHKQKLDHQLYADDEQVYLSTADTSLTQLDDCLSDIYLAG